MAAVLVARLFLLLLLLLLLLLGAVGCGPRARIPPRPAMTVVAPPDSLPATRCTVQHRGDDETTVVPDARPVDDSLAMLARALAPVLYLHRDETFPLCRVVAVVHPTRRVIAYNLLWRDDAHGAWIPFTDATDQEVVWVGYDSTLAPVEIWTYWHKRILHSPWPRTRVEIDVQWGKHGSLPGNVIQGDLPALQTLNAFYALTIVGLPDLLLGRLNRRGPLCFCHGYRRYRQFTRPVPLSVRIDAVVQTAHPKPALRAVFGKNYSEKQEWP